MTEKSIQKNYAKVFFKALERIRGPTKMSTLCLLKKRANWALKMVLFDALLLMLLSKFVSNSTFRRCSSSIIFLTINYVKNTPNIMQI